MLTDLRGPRISSTRAAAGIIAVQFREQSMPHGRRALAGDGPGSVGMRVRCRRPGTPLWDPNLRESQADRNREPGDADRPGAFEVRLSIG